MPPVDDFDTKIRAVNFSITSSDRRNGDTTHADSNESNE